jgi:hypothetical protein
MEVGTILSITLDECESSGLGKCLRPSQRICVTAYAIGKDQSHNWRWVRFES